RSSSQCLIGCDMRFFFSSRRRHTRFSRDWSSDVCSSDLTGMINENDLMFMGDAPHGLTDVLGLVSEEIDGLYDHESNAGVVQQSLATGVLSGSYSCTMLCDLVHLQGAEAIVTYKDDFYAGRAVLTRNSFAKGEAYHIGSHFEDSFYDDFYRE